MRGVRSIHSSKLNKRAQFFILSAVIMASIIVSLATVKNYVSTGDAPKKFYYYSQQLEDETGAVVDYALYSDPSGSNTGNARTNLNNFLQQSIDKTMAGYPSMEIFACYSNLTDPTWLVCQNNGTATINVSTSLAGSLKVLYGSKSDIVKSWVCTSFDRSGNCRVLNPYITRSSFSIAGENNLFVKLNSGQTYTIPIQNSGVQRGQFYFLLKMNTSSGDYVADSTGVKKNIG